MACIILRRGSMAKNSKPAQLYSGFVIAVGIFTVMAIVALAYSIFPSWRLATTVTLCVLVLFGFPILWFLRDTRHRPSAPSAADPTPITQINIPLKLPIRRLKPLWPPVGLSWLGLLIFLNALFAEDFIDAGAVNYLTYFASAWLGIGGLVIWILEEPQQRARRLSHRRSPVLQFGEAGVLVPFELLTSPAYDIALKHGVSDVQIPWAEIETIEVHSARGKSPQQYAMRTHGESAKWGGLLGNWGIIRSPEVLEQEDQVLAALEKKLGAALRIHHG